MSTSNKIFGGLAIAGGAQHILSSALSFDLVGMTAKIASWLPTTVYVVAGAAGIYAGYLLWEKR